MIVIADLDEVTQIRDQIFGGEHPMAELTQWQFSRENFMKSYLD